MESSLAQWQFENISTAELSPPISPLSPSLYNQGGISPNPLSGKNDPKYYGTESRAQLDSNLLRDLQEFESIQYKQENDLGLNWNEASVNLELFSELSDFNYLPLPVSGSLSPQFNSPQIVFEYKASSSIPSSPIPSIPSSPIPSIPSSPIPQQEYPTNINTYDKLSAEFQAILESLPATSGNTSNADFDDLIAISGIPAHYNNVTECISSPLPIENASAFIMPSVNPSPLPMDLDLTSPDYSSLISFDANINNQTVYYSPSIETNIISEEVLNENADAAEKILDALLSGNLSQAQSFIPTIQTLPAENTLTICGITDNILELPSPSPSTSGITKKQSKSKSERKSKTSEGRKRGGLSAIADKSLRKKEQNKTAATRYRLKKKLEAVNTNEVESTMQKANDVLQAESNDLAKQISIVKQLLRDILAAKKASQKPRLF